MIARCAADEASIRTLRRDYAFSAAKGDAQGIARLFVEDGTFSFGHAGGWTSLSGRAEIEKALSVIAPNEVFPLIQDGRTRIEGDTGTGTCMMFSPISPSGEAFGGFYEEIYRRCEDGEWRFVDRRFNQIITK